MTGLASLLGALTAILQSHPVCQHVTILETNVFSPDQFFFKIRAVLPEGFNFQLRIYHNHGHIDYAYQLFSDEPLLRWDNKEEFRYVETYPHHHHDEKGNVTISNLVGDPMQDLEQVLAQIERYLQVQE